jgi:hypothetical protein
MSLTVSEADAINQYTAAPAQTLFSYTFEIFEDADVNVYVDLALQTLTTNYTVQSAGVTGGGTITFAVGRTSGEVITIERALDYKRVTSFQQAQAFDAEDLNTELDRVFMMLQQIESAFRLRGFQVPVTTLLSGIVTNLPAPEAGRFLRWNGAGTTLVNSDGTSGGTEPNTAFIDSFHAATDAASARTILGLGTAAILDTGTGAGQVPTNADLGTAAYVDVGPEDDEVSLNADLNPNCLI